MNRKRLLILCGAPLALAAGIMAFRAGDRYFEIAKSLDIMAAVFRDLNAYYVDSLEPAELMHTGIDAMTQSLDPYTYFYAEDDQGDLAFQTTGRYGGVGASIRQVDGLVTVAELFPRSPLGAAGILPGDIIDSLDGRAAQSMSRAEVSEALKGPAGTTLRITVHRPLQGTPPRTESIRRAEIDIEPVAYAGMVRKDIAYIKMTQFTEGAASAVGRSFAGLRKAHPGLQGLILDLRGNPGGLLEEAVLTAGLFLPRGDTVVSTHGRIAGRDRVFTVLSDPMDTQLPLAVLTNSQSASASEIVAGAVQDLDRGVIVGQRSFGKGLVQTTRSLPYNTSIKITTAKYYTPSGRCIQAIDYAHHREDGSVAYIPDSLKRSFRTRHGRRVTDGGGIAPDREVPQQYISRIAASLLHNNLIFDYATRYYYAHPQAPALGQFRLGENDFQDFVSYLSGKDYAYKTRSEMALERFRETARQEGYFEAVSDEYQALQRGLGHDKRQDLLKHKKEIGQLLEEEIMSRYYMQAGRIAEGIVPDSVVNAAAALLADPGRYQALLVSAGDR